jgi:hypothetical protein
MFGAAAALSYLAAIATLLYLPGWFKSRHRAAARLQIALTDALDGALGPIVAPVVKTPLLGPRRIEIAVPFGRPLAVGRILAVAQETLASEGMAAGSYRLVLSPQSDSRPASGSPCAARPARTGAAA